MRQQQNDGSIQLQHSLEIQGPLLPSCLTELHSLIEKQTEGSFTATYSVHEPTTPFNTTLTQNGERDRCAEEEVIKTWTEEEEERGTEQTSNVAINHKVKSGLRLSKEINNGRQAIRELECLKGRFAWSV